jgi:hypothetical protein
MDNRFEFPVGNWPITILQVPNHWQGMYQLSSSTTYRCTLNCTFAQVRVHS